MADLTERLDRIETLQLDQAEEMKTHQLNDSTEFGKAEDRDKETADTLREINTKLDLHIAKVEPYIQAVSGLGLLSRVFLTLGGLAGSAIAIWSLIRK